MRSIVILCLLAGAAFFAFKKYYPATSQNLIPGERATACMQQDAWERLKARARANRVTPERQFEQECPGCVCLSGSSGSDNPNIPLTPGNPDTPLLKDNRM